MSIVTELQTLLEDSNVFWINAHLYDHLNQAQLEVWGELRHQIGTATITASATNEFLGLPATTVMIPQRVVRGDIEWFVTNKAALGRENKNWRELTPGEPKWFVLFDDNTVQLVPRADSTYAYTVEGVLWPQVEIGDSPNDDITQPYYIRQSVLFLAAANITANTRFDLYQQFYQEYRESLNQAKVELRKFGSHRIRRIRPGNAVTRAHQGDRIIGKNIGANN